MAYSQKASAARDTILSQKDSITKIIGDVNPESIDRLEEEIGGILTTVKSYHFEGGQTNGFLAIIVPQADYCTIINDAAWTYVPPAEQDEYDPAAVNATVAQRAVLEAAWDRKAFNRELFLVVCEAAKELIVHAVGDDALASLKERFVKYGNTTPKAMITHLRDTTCIKMTTLEKDTFKSEGYKQEWDVTQNINVYFKRLNNLTISLANHNIPTSVGGKANAAVARMWESGFFTESRPTE